MLPKTSNNVKVIVVGKTGAGKTGMLAPLIATGQYEVCILDTDKGVRALSSLLTDSRYPYAAYMSKLGVDLNKAVDVLTIDQKMRAANGKIIPSNARGWTEAANSLEKWKHDEIDYGNIGDWGPERVLVIDSFSTLARMAFYFAQQANGRLGADESGNHFRQDIGAAQSLLRKMLELLFCDSVRCNVVIISHITWIDESGGFSTSPEARLERGERPDPDGYPAAVGRALSPHMGKYFNDVFVVKATGSGQSVQRKIHTTPNDGILAKNSAFLRNDYDIRTGLAEIFAEMRGQELPAGFLEALKRPVGR